MVLAIHHEIQYLYFTYAIARQRAPKEKEKERPSREWSFFLAFLFWPVLGLTTALLQMWANIGWLLPLWTGMLLCHYWWDGQIWTRKAFSLSLEKV